MLRAFLTKGTIPLSSSASNSNPSMHICVIRLRNSFHRFSKNIKQLVLITGIQWLPEIWIYVEVWHLTGKVLITFLCSHSYFAEPVVFRCQQNCRHVFYIYIICATYDAKTLFLITGNVSYVGGQLSYIQCFKKHTENAGWIIETSVIKFILFTQWVEELSCIQVCQFRIIDDW